MLPEVGQCYRDGFQLVYEQLVIHFFSNVYMFLYFQFTYYNINDAWYGVFNLHNDDLYMREVEIKYMFRSV